MLQKTGSAALKEEAIGMRRKDGGRQTDLGREEGSSKHVGSETRKMGTLWNLGKAKETQTNVHQTLLPTLPLKDSKSHLNLLIGLRHVIKGYLAHVLPPRVSSAQLCSLVSCSEMTRTLEVFSNFS